MKLLLPALALCALSLTGCVVGPTYSQRMSTFIGQPEKTLVQEMGVPDKRMTINGQTYFTYVEHGVTYIPGTYGWCPGCGPPWGIGYPSEYVYNQCTTTFVISNGLVKSFSFRGSGCW